jgi:glycosyltransferase involved in cell wall biosynthesis
MKVTAVSFKECWRDEAGHWFSDGGFPRQMDGIMSMFDCGDLLIVEKPWRAGGLPLPAVNIIPLREPSGTDFWRKVSVIANLPYYFREIARSVKTADVVHVPLPGDIPLVAMFVAWLYRKPVLARYGGSWAATAETTFMNRVTRASLRLLARGSNVVLATGDGATGPAKGVEWIFSSVISQREVDSIHPRLNRALSQPPRLIYIGRLSQEKGLPVLIKAIQQLAANPRIPRPMVTLVGDGPARRSLEQLVDQSGCREQIRFTGQLNRTELSEQLLAADVCVQPSLTEGFSKAWLDAMVHGVPVVSSDVGAARAVIGGAGERGWIVPPGDVGALAAQLEIVLSDGTIAWPALRTRCRAFADGRTLEDWQERIGGLCARRWDWTFEQGKLRR